MRLQWNGLSHQGQRSGSLHLLAAVLQDGYWGATKVQDMRHQLRTLRGPSRLAKLASDKVIQGNSLRAKLVIIIGVAICLALLRVLLGEIKFKYSC